jgi:hypothetical protein
MSIGSIGSFNQTAAMQAPDNAAKVQVEREDKKVDSDSRADAPPASGEVEEKATTGTVGTMIDMYL